MDFRITSVGASGGFHADESGRRHLSTCHTVNGIVDKNDGDVITTVQGVNAFGSSDTCQVAIALICEYQAVGPQALDGSCQCGCTSVCGFLAVDVQVIIHKDGTSYRADTDGFFSHAHFVDDFSYQLVYDSMAASRAVVHRVVVQ